MYIKEQGKRNIAIIAYDEDLKVIASAIPYAYTYSFGKTDDETLQAHNLFAILRDADLKNFDEIYAPLPKKTGISLALYNRMIRAAAHKIIRM